MPIALVILLVLLVAGETIAVPPANAQPTDSSAQPSQVQRKIQLDWSRLSSEGLVGPEDGLRSLRYEFCIPADPQRLADVQAIDPTLAYFPHSRGRIGCMPGEYLCIGDTHQPHWREVLEAIANLEYVERIVESFAE